MPLEWKLPSMINPEKMLPWTCHNNITVMKSLQWCETLGWKMHKAAAIFPIEDGKWKMRLITIVDWQSNERNHPQGLKVW